MAFTPGAFFRLVRYPNLIMTALAIWIHWYFLIARPVQQMQQETHLNHWIILAIGLTFGLVMGAGFVINDIIDQPIDQINRGSRQIVGTFISTPMAWRIYWILNILALIVSFLIASQLGLLKYFFLMPASILMLYFYSVKLKKAPFVGNIWIALLCAFVLWIPFIGEAYHLDTLVYKSIFSQFLYCSLVAFSLTLMRELIKDVQDMNGDKADGAKTMPIIWGLKKTYILIVSLAAMAILLLISGIGLFHLRAAGVLLIGLGLILPLGFIIFGFMSSLPISSMGRYSTLVKILMAIGMFLLPLSLSIFRL